MRNIVIGIIVAAIAIAAIERCSLAVIAQEDHHARGHTEYQMWTSERTSNCCQGTEEGGDCRFLEESEWRENKDGIEVKVGNEWCPVEKQHYLTHGSSPDFSRAHACITQHGIKTCDRLLCFLKPAGT